MADRSVDPERLREPNAFNRPTGYSGEEYDRDRETEQGRQAPEPATPTPDDHPGIPTHAGERASIDPDTGAVSGAGMGAGGGQPGEDSAIEAAGGSGYPLTGGEGTDHRPDALGPKNDKAGYL